MQPEARDAFDVFIRCSTQWRKILPPMGGKIIYEGLRYEAVEAVIKALGFRGKRARTAFLDVQKIEYAALEELK